MTITPGLAAELDRLTQALDVPGTDVADTLTRLAADAQTAVDSYLGLSVTVSAHRSQVGITVLTDRTGPEDILTSLLIPLSTVPGGRTTTPASVTLILYAATAGAFIDLAADLSWITGRALTEFRLDEHLVPPPDHPDATAVGAESVINQAVGVLIGQGSSPEQAERDIYARAVSAGTDPLGTATLILAALNRPDPGPR